MFTDIITIYNYINSTWQRTVVHGVQWSDRQEKQNNGGKISVAKYASLTFPVGTYEGLTLRAGDEDAAIFYGEITETVTIEKGHRLSDLLDKYPKSGRIKAVNDNSNREHLKNIKVVIG